VTESGAPSSSCAVQMGSTEPAEPSTLPKRTMEKRVGPCGAASEAT
jgi:hypothetical protein